MTQQLHCEENMEKTYDILWLEEMNDYNYSVLQRFMFDEFIFKKTLSKAYSICAECSFSHAIKRQVKRLGIEKTDIAT